MDALRASTARDARCLSRQDNADLGSSRNCYGGLWVPPQGSIRPLRAPSRVVQVTAKMPPAGRYGGPPVDRKIRKTWGGNDTKDPLESGDYLWDNREQWKRVLDKELRRGSPGKDSPEQSDSSDDEDGPLAMNRTLALNSVDVDLSQELSKPRRSLQEKVDAMRAQAGLAPIAGSPAEASRAQWRPIGGPTQRQGKKLDTGKESGWAGYALDGSGSSALTPEEVEAQQEKAFQELKNALQLNTLLLAVTFSATAAVTYSPEVGASFAIGSLGSLVYVRMLNSSVESLGKQGVGAAARGSLSQPRLLVPVVLVMAYNRWNALLVPEYGLVELQLIPMLLGFFTYKAAALVQTFNDIFSSMASPYMSDSQTSSAEDSAPPR